MTANNPYLDFAPNTKEYEDRVLAALIASPEHIGMARKIITADMFTTEVACDVWETLCEMEDAGERIDLLTVSAKSEDKSFILELCAIQDVPSSMIGVTQYCNLLRDGFFRLKCYEAGVELMRRSMEPGKSIDEIINIPDELSQNLRRNLSTTDGTESLSEAVDSYKEEIEEIRERKAKGEELRISTGFPTLDYLTYGGWTAGDLIIIAARPSVGKTAVMLQMAKAASMNGAKSPLLFNLEMSNKQLVQRLLTSTGKVNSYKLATAQSSKRDIDEAASQFEKNTMFLNEKAYSLEAICSSIILNHKIGKCDIAFIDHLGLIDHDITRNGTLAQAIASETRRFKQLSKDLNIPIVLLCQLNRSSAAEGRSPELYDLRDSGSIEQDADIVVMLERPSRETLQEMLPDEIYINLTDDKKLLAIWVRKNRQGAAGHICFICEAKDGFTRFEELNAPEQPHEIPPMPVNEDIAYEDLDLPF